MESCQQIQNLDQDIFTLINQIRADPLILVPHLELMLTQFEGDIWKRGNGKADLKTKDGEKPVKEVLKWIPNLKGIPALKWKDSLQAAAKEYVQDLAPKGVINTQSTAAAVGDRLKK